MGAILDLDDMAAMSPRAMRELQTLRMVLGDLLEVTERVVDPETCSTGVLRAIHEAQEQLPQRRCSDMSPDAGDLSLEPAEIVAAIDRAGGRIHQLAAAITPQGALRGSDATGVSVGSLTEAVMGVSAGLVRIAEAIDGLADAMRERNA